MTEPTIFISDTNLSHAWLRAFREAAEDGVDELVPLIVQVTEFEAGQPKEDPRVRSCLDEALEQQDEAPCRTVSSTIFPRSLWNPERSRDELYARYKGIFGRVKHDAKNRYGTYFERMIAYPKANSEPINQLERLIQVRLNHPARRRSALQIALFDPTRDEPNQAMRGFPCLQQIAVAPFGNGKLAVTGFYPIQYLFERAYGNYLGLCALGQFIAHELKLEMAQMTCVAGIAQLGNITKTAAHDLIERVGSTTGCSGQFQ